MENKIKLNDFLTGSEGDFLNRCFENRKSLSQVEDCKSYIDKNKNFINRFNEILDKVENHK